jgi:hypothetical protein
MLFQKSIVSFVAAIASASASASAIVPPGIVPVCPSGLNPYCCDSSAPYRNLPESTKNPLIKAKPSLNQNGDVGTNCIPLPAQGWYCVFLHFSYCMK